MTSNDEAAVEAIVAGMQPAHTMHGFAINILAAIRDGKVPGIRCVTECTCMTDGPECPLHSQLDALRAELAAAKEQLAAAPKKTHDGTTCWQCEACGKTRTGRGCLVCLETALADSRAEADHLRDELAEMTKERDVLTKKSSYLEKVKDHALSQRVAAVTEVGHLRSQLAAATDAERGALALRDAIGLRLAEVENERDAATAEASALREELHWIDAQLIKAHGLATDHVSNRRLLFLALPAWLEQARSDLAEATAEAGNLRALLNEAFQHIAVNGTADSTDLPDRMQDALTHSAVALEMRGDKE